MQIRIHAMLGPVQRKKLRHAQRTPFPTKLQFDDHSLFKLSAFCFVCSTENRRWFTFSMRSNTPSSSARLLEAITDREGLIYSLFTPICVWQMPVYWFLSPWSHRFAWEGIGNNCLTPWSSWLKGNKRHPPDQRCSHSYPTAQTPPAQMPEHQVLQGKTFHLTFALTSSNGFKMRLIKT